MGRIGVSEYQVFQAADQLAADGVQPSVDTVRTELGNTGSRTTINKYLRLWRERKAHRDAAGANLSGHLRQVISDQAELLLSALEAESSAKFQTKSQEFEANIQSLLEKNRQLDQACLDKQATIDALQEASKETHRKLTQSFFELKDLSDQNQDLRQALATELGRREVLKEAISERDARIASLQREIKLSTARNEILSEGLATKNSDLQYAQQRERSQAALIKQKTDEVKRLNREIIKARTQCENELSRLTQTLAKLIPSNKEKTLRKSKARVEK